MIVDREALPHVLPEMYSEPDVNRYPLSVKNQLCLDVELLNYR